MKPQLLIGILTLIPGLAFKPVQAQITDDQSRHAAADPNAVETNDPLASTGVAGQGPALPGEGAAAEYGTFDPRFTPGSPGSAARALAILKEPAVEKDLSGVEEDLRIMGRVLRKAANGGEASHRNAMGILVHRSSGSDPGGPRDLYLDGYGALFFLSTDYPLLAPVAKSPATEGKEDTSSEWEEARRELQHPQNRFGLENPPDYFMTMTGPSGEPYDADRVASLKTGLIAALKNAAHVRRLKSEETVTVVVTGHGGNGGGGIFSRGSGSSGGFGGSGTMAGGGQVMMGSAARTMGEGRGGTLILRVRKSDAEAFQAGKMSAADFRQKVMVVLR